MFEIGDRVRVLRPSLGLGIDVIGIEGTVVSVSTAQNFSVRPDDGGFAFFHRGDCLELIDGSVNPVVEEPVDNTEVLEVWY